MKHDVDVMHSRYMYLHASSTRILHGPCYVHVIPCACSGVLAAASSNFHYSHDLVRTHLAMPGPSSSWSAVVVTDAPSCFPASSSWLPCMFVQNVSNSLGALCLGRVEALPTVRGLKLHPRTLGVVLRFALMRTAKDGQSPIKMADVC